MVRHSPDNIEAVNNLKAVMFRHSPDNTAAVSNLQAVLGRHSLVHITNVNEYVTHGQSMFRILPSDGRAGTLLVP